MSFLENLRMKQAYRILEKRRKRHRVAHRSVAFREAAEIALLFKADSMEDVLRAKEFFSYLKEQGKKVSVLGFTAASNETGFKTKSVFFDYFSEKDLDPFFIPKPGKIADFMKTPFDILISFCVTDCFPLCYIAALSRATFRVGVYSSRQVDDFDLMINLKEDRNIDNFALQLKQYLSLPASA